MDKAGRASPTLARLLNATTPGVLAEEAAHLGAWLVHYSTDYVFDGGGTRPRVGDRHTCTAQLLWQNPLEGEQRTSNRAANRDPAHQLAYGGTRRQFRQDHAAPGAGARSPDRHRRPVGRSPQVPDLLADVTAHVVRRCSGVRRTAACTTGGSRRDQLEFVCKGTLRPQTGANQYQMKHRRRPPLPTSAFPTPAARPQSRLSTARLRFTLRPAVAADWRDGVARKLQRRWHKISHRLMPCLMQSEAAMRTTSPGR